jgi:hypothetical protein
MGLGATIDEDDDEVPVLVENFEEVSKAESSTQKDKKDEKGGEGKGAKKDDAAGDKDEKVELSIGDSKGSTVD